MSEATRSTLEGRIHIKHGFPFKGDLFRNSGEFVVLTPGNFYEKGGFRRNAEKDKYYAGEFPREYLLDKGELIVAMTEQAEGLLGSMALIPDSGKFLHNQRLGLVCATSDDVDLTYLYYLFRTSWVRKQIYASSTGSKVKHTSPERLYAVQVDLPPPRSQRGIAAVLAALDAKIAVNERICRKLDQTASLIYDYWFAQFDFPITDTMAASLGDPGAAGQPYRASGAPMVYSPELGRELPSGWEVGSLLDVGSFTNGIACQKYPPDDDGCLPVIKIREMRRGFSADSDVVTRHVPEKIKISNGDVLFSWSASLEVMIWAGGEGALNQHIFKVTSDSYPRSVYYFLLLSYLRHFRMMAELRKTTMGHITRGHLEQSRVAIPDGEVAAAFDAVVNPVLERSLRAREESMRLEELRDWLLPLLMNGQVAVE